MATTTNEPNGLNDLQKKFCQEYVVDLNGKQAAIRAGYSAKTAEVTASKLLIIPKVRTYVTKLQEDLARRTEITAERVLKEFAKIGFADLSEYLNEGYTVKQLKDLKGKTAAISSVEIFEGKAGKSVTFKLHSKVQALENMAKHLGMFEKDNAQKAPLVSPTIILAAKNLKK